MEAARSPSGGRWSNPPPPGTEFDYYDDGSDASSKRREPKSPAHRSRSKSYERKRRSKRRSRSRSSRERRRRSRSKSRRRKRRRSASRSRSRRRHEHRRRKRRTRSRSESRPRRRDKDKKSRPRGDRADSDARHCLDGDVVKEEDMRLEDDEEDDEDEEETNPVPFKNDGTFLEMFKKMQEMQKVKEEPAEDKAAEAKRPVLPPTFGKRRGGKVLKTGVVQKVRAKDDEEEASTSNDAWSIYMKEVRKYKEACCDDDSKTRPLVK